MKNNNNSLRTVVRAKHTTPEDTKGRFIIHCMVVISITAYRQLTKFVKSTHHIPAELVSPSSNGTVRSLPLSSHHLLTDSTVWA